MSYIRPEGCIADVTTGRRTVEARSLFFSGIYEAHGDMICGSRSAQRRVEYQVGGALFEDGCSTAHSAEDRLDEKINGALAAMCLDCPLKKESQAEAEVYLRESGQAPAPVDQQR